MTLFALQNVGNQYVLFGVAGLVCLVIFIALILSPALGAYGRIWEKTVAGFLSVFVLAALIVIGVVIGLTIVYHYPEISEFFNGE